MYNGGRVLAGLAVFFVIATLPFWLGFGAQAEAPELDLNTPRILQMPEQKCVLPVETMRSQHMELLKDWRDWAIRDGRREYQAWDGTVYPVSLQNTCLDCHSNKADFCDRCHDYSNVEPDCWTCHLEPEEVGL
ncbi:MAG TPA: sulfate reduction electron transfer complex DsrMKJOP subunit DsrJ [Clostridia bacterium]|nr:sulfate reduction electron transfer complex DsrMKJOP subunit DsrJ [Clostridia bacterium]